MSKLIDLTGLSRFKDKLFALIGSANGIASLDENGVVPTAQLDLSAKANLNSPIFTGTPKAPTAADGTNTTQIATTAFVMNTFKANDAMIFKGTIGTGGTVTALPATHDAGWTYKVVTAATYAGKACEVGDMIICVADGTVASDDDWAVIQSNIDGAVTGPSSSVTNSIAVFDGLTGKIIKDSHVLISDKANVANPVFTGSISRDRYPNSSVGENSTAIGYHCRAYGKGSYAEGDTTTARGDYSHAQGLYTIANGPHSNVLGEFNVGETIPEWSEWASNTAYSVGDRKTRTTGSGGYYTRTYYYCIVNHTSSASISSDSDKWITVAVQAATSIDAFNDPVYNLQLEIVGNGTNQDLRSNARALDRFGNERLKGDLYVGCNADSSGGTKVAKITDVPDVTGKADKANPVFSGSISMGRKSGTIIGTASVVLGSNGQASGNYSFCEGGDNKATESYDHAEGNGTTASGGRSHAEGNTTTASGSSSHAEGSFTTASSNASHAEGMRSIASGEFSHAEGYYTIAKGHASHVSGQYNVEDSYDNWPEWVSGTHYYVGDKVKVTTETVDGYVCTTENTDNTFNSSHWLNQYGTYNYTEIVGNGTANNARSNARALDWDGNEYLKGNLYVGCNANSTGGTKVATETYVSGNLDAKANKANAEFTESISMYREEGTVVGHGSVAIGGGTIASGYYSLAHGQASADPDESVPYQQLTASSLAAHAEGLGTTASNEASHAEGYRTTASGEHSHAEGHKTTASGKASHAAGYMSTASGLYSDASGTSTTAKYKSQHTFGEYNVIDSNGNDQTVRGNYIEIVGNGTSNSAKSNARTLDWNGNERLKGDLYVGCNANSSGGNKVATEAYVTTRIPTPPSNDGTYLLKLVVSSGTATYGWEEISSISGAVF